MSKIRNGFVSNSSSSSFLIYGACVDSFLSDKDFLLELKRKFPQFEHWPEDEYIHKVSKYDLLEFLAVTLSLEDYSDDCRKYIGKSWGSIKDDETGKQFKESIEKNLKEIFGDTIDVRTYEETYYN